MLTYDVMAAKIRIYYALEYGPKIIRIDKKKDTLVARYHHHDSTNELLFYISKESFINAIQEKTKSHTITNYYMANLNGWSTDTKNIAIKQLKELFKNESTT